MSAPGMTASAFQQPQVPVEKSALTKTIWFGILQVIGNVIGFILPLFVFWPLFFSSTPFNIPPNATPSQVGAALAPLFQNLTLQLGVGLGIGLISSVILAIVFRDFKKVDSSKFNAPWILVIILIIGTVISAVGLVPMFNSIPNVISQAPSSSTTPSAAFLLAIQTLFLSLAIAGIGGILVFIGVIGGEILGLWRIGSRYDNSLIKVGAILEIIPLLSFVAPILVLIGANEAKGRLGVI